MCAVVTVIFGVTQILFRYECKCPINPVINPNLVSSPSHVTISVGYNEVLLCGVCYYTFGPGMLNISFCSRPSIYVAPSVHITAYEIHETCKIY
jgi:hypothetical protein